MSEPGPLGGGNPFEGLPIFGDLAKLFATEGPVNWEIARQLAGWVANEGEAETNVDPLARIRMEELARVADLNVAEVTGLATTSGGRVVRPVPVGRAEWARQTLDAYRPLFELLATTLGGARTGEDDPQPDPTTEFLGNLTQIMSPVLLGMQAGMTVGHLAQRALGLYGLPIPRPESADLLVVAANVEAFANDWSLPIDDVTLWVAVEELVHHNVLGLRHVRLRVNELIAIYISGFEVDPTALETKLGSVDPSDPASFQAALGDPETLLGAIQTEAQRGVQHQLEAVAVVVEGYVDHVVDVVGRKLIASYGALAEALRRRRVERGEGERFVDRLFGLDIGQQQYERGAAFVRGVLERAGEEGLQRLWVSARELPTPAEVDAPGLWLARIDIPD